MNKVIVVLIAFTCLIPGFARAADSCLSSVIGLQIGSGDSYGSTSDFSGTTNHFLYYDYKCPTANGPSGLCLSGNRSMVNSIIATCEQFANVLTVGGGCPGGNTVCLNPGLNWANNNGLACNSINGCDGLDDDGILDTTDRMVMVLYNTTTTAPYVSKVLVDSVAYDLTNNRYSFNSSIGTNHALFTMPAPSIQSATCNGSSCTLTVRITEPNFSAAGATGGIYGDDAGTVNGVTRGLIAGYKIVGVQLASAPANGLATNYNIAAVNFSGTSRYIPASRPPVGGNVTSASITISGLSGSNPLFVAYAPIFNYDDSQCTGGTQCTAAQLQTLDTGLGANNSLTSRIASPPSQPIGPNPVKFVSFNGTWKGSKVTLTWVTASEVDLAGFNLYRMVVDDGSNDAPGNNNASKPKATPEWVKVNAVVIPSLSQGGSGATYTYIDKVTAGTQVKYMVKEVPLNNTPPDSMETTVTKKKIK